jgi:hypothetical protein
MSEITLEITHPTLAPGPLQGFNFFWAFYVKGFRPEVHCQPCFRGSVSPQFNSRTARSGQIYVMDERRAFPFLYLCGVGVGPKNLLHQKNFHLALRPEPGAREVRETYNGYTITVENAVALPIPELPEGWNGLNRETTRCKNFRFGVEYFGWNPTARSLPYSQQPT